MKKSQFLQVAIEAAKNAEKIILEHYSNNLKWERKSDLSPVTIADTESEKAIIETIKKSFPNHSFLGEESGEDSLTSEYQWVIDPIDGTKNYARQIPLFGTQIALMHHGEIIVGVSNAPALKEMLYAEKGKGAFLNDQKINVSDIQDLSESYLYFGGIKYFRKLGLVDSLVNLSEKAWGHRGVGDCICYHMLAQGKVEIMVEASIKIWDIAALTIIVEEAGGKVTDIEGKPITKDSSTILATNGKFHDLIVGTFKK